MLTLRASSRLQTCDEREKAQLMNGDVELKSKDVTPTLVARTDMRVLLRVGEEVGCGLSSATEP